MDVSHAACIEVAVVQDALQIGEPQDYTKEILSRRKQPADRLLLTTIPYLTPSDITIVCLERLGYEISEAKIVKMRQRLKLKPFRGRKLRAKYVVTDPKTGTTKISFPELDK